jgi:putative methyltransferase (TIGR04325 family)
MTFQIFKKKIYKTYEDAKLFIKKDNIYFSKDYIKRNVKKLNLQVKKKNYYDFEYSFLKFLDTILILNKNKFNLLDYGGGLGNTILEIYLKDLFKNNLRISLYDLNVDFVNYSEKFLKKTIKKDIYKKIIFIKDSKHLRKKYDAIHFGSMLEYVYDEEVFFKNIFSQILNKPKFLFFSDVYVTNPKKKDFYCVGNYYSQNYIVKFHNLKRLIIMLDKKGYKLVDKRKFLPNIHSQYKFYNMSNLPKANRIFYTMNLTFIKK